MASRNYIVRLLVKRQQKGKFNDKAEKRMKIMEMEDG
jgi:hypothetical protein